MTLLNPIGLAGLLSLPVILALHLLFQRQRRHVVSSLDLWSFLDMRARGPQARRIPITWILLVDLLIGTLLSLAWAQPRVAIAMPIHGPRHLVILVDVSTSMQARDSSLPGAPNRLDQAKGEITALLGSVQAQDVVTILGFGRQARVIADSRQNDLAYLTSRINALQVGESGSALREALALGEGGLDKNLPAEFHIITDGDFALENAGELSVFAYPLIWNLVGKSVENQAVIELNATPLGANRTQVFARVANFGSQEVAREAVLEVDGVSVDRAVIRIPADASIPRVWQIPVESGQKPGEVTVSLRGADALPADDLAVIGLHSGGTIRAALVSNNPGPVQQAISAIPGVDFKIILPAEYASALAQEATPFDLTIFDNFLPDRWPAGHVLVVNPPAGNGAPAGGGNPPAGAPSNAPTGAPSLSVQSAREIPANAVVQNPNPDPVVEGIDFNGVRWVRAWSLASPATGFVPLLQANDTPLLLRGEIHPAQSERSRVFVLLADLTRGNFTKQAAYPILIANLVEDARRAPLPPGFLTGEPVPLPARGSYQSIQITPPHQAEIQLEQDWPAEWTQTLNPGLYQFRFTRASGETMQFSAGARAGEAMESDLRPRGWTQAVGANSAGANSATTSPETTQKERPVDLRIWLLGAAVVLLGLEATLAWRR